MVARARDTNEKTGPFEARVRDAREGSGQAMGRLLEDFRTYLYLAARYSIPPALRAKLGASDLVQETFLEAQRDFGRFRGRTRSELLAWLQRILLNNVRNAQRHYRDTEKRQVGREVPLDAMVDSDLAPRAEPSDDPSCPCENAIRREWRQSLEQTLTRLPDTYRQAVIWRHQEHCSFQEIGARLNCSAEAARKLWSRAILQLQRELGSTR